MALRQEGRHFEVVAGKVIDAHGIQSRFAFARNSPTVASRAFKQALAAADVQADTPATVLCDGDAGLVARVSPHRARAAGGPRPAASAQARPTPTLANKAIRELERAKWRLWHGCWAGYQRKLAALCRWARRKHVRDVAGIGRLRHSVSCWATSSGTRRR